MLQREFTEMLGRRRSGSTTLNFPLFLLRCGVDTIWTTARAGRSVTRQLILLSTGVHGPVSCRLIRNTVSANETAVTRILVANLQDRDTWSLWLGATRALA